MAGLERFVDAQERDYAEALAEMRAGRKRSHWIWYVFPQIAGLGTSSFSREYAIRDLDEALEYLRHPVLSARLVEIATAALEHLRRGASIEQLMGGSVDAGKLVSSMTLFGEAARRLPARAGSTRPAGDDAHAAALAPIADEMLTLAESQGYGRCAHTLTRLQG